MFIQSCVRNIIEQKRIPSNVIMMMPFSNVVMWTLDAKRRLCGIVER